jgi:hypothetical protein
VRIVVKCIGAWGLGARWDVAILLDGMELWVLARSAPSSGEDGQVYRRVESGRYMEYCSKLGAEASGR